MKKIFTTVCASAIILTSCSNDSLVSSAPPAAITYGVTAGNVSRAADSYSTNNLPSSFKVWAVTPGATSAFIDGHTIERKGNNSWEDSAGPKYWPASSLDFFAVVNDGGTFSLNGGSPKLNNFTVKPNASEQTDVLYAVAYGCTVAKPNVPINFNHALAQVGFKAVCSNASLSVVVRSVTVGHVGGKATFTFPASEEAQGSWTAPTDIAAYTVALEPAIEVGATATNLTCAASNDVSKVLTLIPQSENAWNPKELGSDYNGAYFLVDCKITNKTTSATLRDGQIAIPVEIKWEAGKRYVYTFTFSSHTGGYSPHPDKPDPVFVPIGYNVEVDGFDPATDGDMSPTV